MRLLFAILLSVSGCGQIIGIDTNRPLDAGVEATTDAPDVVKPASCDHTEPFGPVTWMLELATVRAETQAVLTADERTIFFLSDRDNPTQWNYEIFTASRTSRTAAWENVHQVKELAAQKEQFSGVAISQDGLDIYYSRSTFSGPDDNRAIYHAHRSTIDGTFDAPTKVFDHPDSEFDMALSPTRDLYVSITPKNGNSDLWLARPSGNNAWSTATKLVFLDLNPMEHERSPAISYDELALYFSTSDAISGQIQVVHRGTKEEAWSSPTLVTELDLNNYGESASWLSPDNCRIYLATYTKDLKNLDQHRYWWDLAVASRR